MDRTKPTHTGTVVQTMPGKALVRVKDQESCEHCGHDTGCGLRQHGGKEIWVIDRFGTNPGMSVEIDISSEGLLAASFVLYGIPLAFLLTGAVTGQLLNGEGGSAIGAGIGLLLGLPLVRFLANRIPEKRRFVAYIKTVLGDRSA